MRDYQIIILILGILFSQIVSKILKRIIKQNRPIKSKTYGMPSTRSTIITFIIFYLILINNFKLNTKITIIILGLISISVKYMIKETRFKKLLKKLPFLLLFYEAVHRIWPQGTEPPA